MHGGASIASLLGEIAGIGRDARCGGYSRHGFQRPELELREWFVATAGGRGMDVECDRNGNLWAWWGRPGPDAVVTGSHLDSVPGGGAFDGPLGVITALVAVDALRAGGFSPSKPVAVAVFAEEEGGRVGVPCLGSRLLAGATSAADALRLTDPNGTTLAEALSAVAWRRSGSAGMTRHCAGSAVSSSCTSSRVGDWSAWTARSDWPAPSWRTGAGASP